MNSADADNCDGVDKTATVSYNSDLIAISAVSRNKTAAAWRAALSEGTERATALPQWFAAAGPNRVVNCGNKSRPKL